MPFSRKKWCLPDETIRKADKGQKTLDNTDFYGYIFGVMPGKNQKMEEKT
jgi:hypothetical protein